MIESSWNSWFAEREETHLAELFDFLRIPSVSALPDHRSDVRRAANWIADRMRQAGIPDVEVLETGGHPLVIGHWQVDLAKPTAMIYAHYDVQPPDPLDLWESPPFEPEIRDGKIYARGSGDDKAGLLATILAVEAMAARDGQPPINLVFFFEGEEEISSPSVAPYLRENASKVKADFVISADGMMLDENTPALTISTKGIAGCEIVLTTASTDMHSGLYGASVRNAAQAMAELVASFHDDAGRVAVKGFYNQVNDPTDREREELDRVPFDAERYFGAVGVSDLWGEPGFYPLERLWLRPTLDINGMWSGFQGSGSKTVTPSEARVKITCRLVPDQVPADILDRLEDHARANCPPGATLKFIGREGSALPYAIDREHPALLAAEETLRDLFGSDPAIIRVGGTIPIAQDFKQELDADLIFFAWSLPDCNAHAPNEWFRLEDFRVATVSTCEYLERLGRA
ncbi:MAG: dipeptidase [Thermomicrobiales bacterium]|nr:dipeptidase [Thermomicrobiales bacterium]